MHYLLIETEYIHLFLYMYIYSIVTTVLRTHQGNFKKLKVRHTIPKLNAQLKVAR